MSTYLHTLLTRGLHPEAALQPRLLSRFEPPPQETDMPVPDEAAERLPGQSHAAAPQAPARGPHEQVLTITPSSTLPPAATSPTAPQAEPQAEKRSSPPEVAPRVQHPVPALPPAVEAARTISVHAEPAVRRVSATPERPAKPVDAPAVQGFGEQTRSPTPPPSALPPRPSGVPGVRLLPRAEPSRQSATSPSPTAGAAPAASPVSPEPATFSGERLRSPTPEQAPSARQGQAKKPPSPPPRFEPSLRPRRASSVPEEERTPPASSPEPPTIRVHIGRIEVKAATPPPTPVPTPPPQPRRPALSLEDYLNRRNEGRR